MLMIVQNVTQSQTENDVESQPEQTGAAVLSINQNVSFLPTARVKVQARDGSWQTATLLFDSGADRSYVSKSLVSKVNPKWVKTLVCPSRHLVVVVKGQSQRYFSYLFREPLDVLSIYKL